MQITGSHLLNTESLIWFHLGLTNDSRSCEVIRRWQVMFEADKRDWNHSEVPRKSSDSTRHSSANERDTVDTTKTRRS